MPRHAVRLPALAAALLLFAACDRAPPGEQGPPAVPPPKPTGTGLPVPEPRSSRPCVESCGTPALPCQALRERIPQSERPAHALHYAVDDSGNLFAAFNVFIGTDPLDPQLETRIAAREPSGAWHVRSAPWPDLHGLVVASDGSLIVHADPDRVLGGGTLFRLERALEQLRSGGEPAWSELGGRHGERVPVLGSLELTPQGTLASAFESPFALGVFDGTAWRREVVGDFYQLQSPHIAVDDAGTAHAFVAYPGRYDEPLWVAPPAAPEQAPVAGPFALESAPGGARVHVLGQRCTSTSEVCFNGAQVAGWELVYAVRDGGAWRTPLVLPNFSTDPENACVDCAAVESDARAPAGAALGGCGGLRLFIERTWNRPSCAQLPEGAAACSGTRLEIVTFSGETAQTTSVDEDLPPVRRVVTSSDGAFHALGVAPDRTGIDYLRLEAAPAP